MTQKDNSFMIDAICENEKALKAFEALWTCEEWKKENTLRDTVEIVYMACCVKE